MSLDERDTAVAPLQALLGRVLEVTRNSALAEMASGIAHELNQPFGAIAAYAQAAQRMLDRPEPMIGPAREVLKQITHEALSAGEGIRKIRRLFDGHDATRATFPMAALVEEIMPVLSLLAANAGGHMQLSATDACAVVMADRSRIQHVILVLVQNAFDAAVAAEAVPLVRIAIESDRYAVETSVFDPGRGVPNSYRERLFTPFYSTKTNGVGLGLAASRSIVQAHEGSIGFENIAAGGCRFWIRLPRVEPG